MNNLKLINLSIFVAIIFSQIAIGQNFRTDKDGNKITDLVSTLQEENQVLRNRIAELKNNQSQQSIKKMDSDSSSQSSLSADDPRCSAIVVPLNKRVQRLERILKLSSNQSGPNKEELLTRVQELNESNLELKATNRKLSKALSNKSQEITDLQASLAESRGMGQAFAKQIDTEEREDISKSEFILNKLKITENKLELTENKIKDIIDHNNSLKEENQNLKTVIPEYELKIANLQKSLKIKSQLPETTANNKKIKLADKSESETSFFGSLFSDSEDSDSKEVASSKKKQKDSSEGLIGGLFSSGASIDKKIIRTKLSSIEKLIFKRKKLIDNARRSNTAYSPKRIVADNGTSIDKIRAQIRRGNYTKENLKLLSQVQANLEKEIAHLNSL